MSKRPCRSITMFISESSNCLRNYSGEYFCVPNIGWWFKCRKFIENQKNRQLKGNWKKCCQTEWISIVGLFCDIFFFAGTCCCWLGVFRGQWYVMSFFLVNSAFYKYFCNNFHLNGKFKFWSKARSKLTRLIDIFNKLTDYS